jgi:hypothetical protein
LPNQPGFRENRVLGLIFNAMMKTVCKRTAADLKFGSLFTDGPLPRREPMSSISDPLPLDSLPFDSLFNLVTQLIKAN